jgi:predicted Zn-dependent protease
MDLTRAEKEIDRALACDPAEPLGHWARGMHWLSLARFDAARDALDTAAALDPTNVTVLLHRGIASFCAGDVDGALARSRELARFEPRVVAAGMAQALFAALAGRHDEAQEVASRLLAAPDSHPQLRPIVGLVLARCGRRDAALEQLAEIDRRAAAGAFLMPTFVAALALELGDTARALRALHEAADAPCPWAWLVPVLPTFASLRGDPSFHDVCGRLGRADVLAAMPKVHA